MTQRRPFPGEEEIPSAHVTTRSSVALPPGPRSTASSTSLPRVTQSLPTRPTSPRTTQSLPKRGEPMGSLRNGLVHRGSVALNWVTTTLSRDELETMRNNLLSAITAAPGRALLLHIVDPRHIDLHVSSRAHDEVMRFASQFRSGFAKVAIVVYPRGVVSAFFRSAFADTFLTAQPDTSCRLFDERLPATRWLVDGMPPATLHVLEELSASARR